MQLTDRVHLVGGGPWGGTGLSVDPDCHVYLIDGGDELALIDAGSGVPGSLEAITETIALSGFRIDQVTTVFVTHRHGDHLGGVAGLVEAADAVARGSGPTIDALRSGDEEVTSISMARRAGLFPPEFELRSTDAAEALTAGARVRIGEVSVTAVDTPGHCDGHLSYLLESDDRRDLFAGDAVFWRGRVLVQAVPDCDPYALAGSLKRLAAIEQLSGFFPGHGGFTTRGGSRHIAAAAEQVRTARLPQSL